MTIRSNNIEFYRRLYQHLDLDIGEHVPDRRRVQTSIVPTIDVREVTRDHRLVRGSIAVIGANDLESIIGVPEDEEWHVHALQGLMTGGDREFEHVLVSRPDQTLQIRIDGGAANTTRNFGLVLPTPLILSGLNIPDLGGFSAEGRPTQILVDTNSAGATDSAVTVTMLITRYNIGRL